jgi:hypothetical protein
MDAGLPEELVVTLLHLLDLRTALAMAVVSKHLNHITTNTFDDKFWATLGIDLLGFKPLKCTKGDLVQAIRVRENILNSRFSLSWVTQVQLGAANLMAVHNKWASTCFHSLDLSSGCQPGKPVPTRYCPLRAKQGHMTNISNLFRDLNNHLYVQLMDGRMFEIPFPCEIFGDIMRDIILIGDIVIFPSASAFFDTSDPKNSETPQLQHCTNDQSPSWVACGIFVEGMCYTDLNYTRWKIVPWGERPQFDKSWIASYYVCCTTFVWYFHYSASLPPPLPFFCQPPFPGPCSLFLFPIPVPCSPLLPSITPFSSSLLNPDSWSLILTNKFNISLRLPTYGWTN